MRPCCGLKVQRRLSLHANTDLRHSLRLQCIMQSLQLAQVRFHLVCLLCTLVCICRVVHAHAECCKVVS